MGKALYWCHQGHCFHEVQTQKAQVGHNTIDLGIIFRCNECKTCKEIVDEIKTKCSLLNIVHRETVSRSAMGDVLPWLDLV